MAGVSEETRRQRLDYIQSMLAELRKMADADRHDLLAYLIDMASVEAGELLRGGRASRPSSSGRIG